MIILATSFRDFTSGFLAALFLASVSPVFAEGSSGQSVVLFDAGQPRRFELAADELHFRDRAGASWVQRLPVEYSFQRAAARAVGLSAATGAEVKLVLYPAGTPRTELTRRLLTRQVLLRLTPGTSAEAVLAGVPGVARWTSVEYLPGAVLVEATDPAGALELADALRRRPGAQSAAAQLARQHERKLVPNDTYFSYQWHLRNAGQFGGTIDVNIVNVWNTYRGAGIVIGLLDDGLETAHPDLAPNVNAALSYDFNDGDTNPNPVLAEDGHGTSCAGIAAARGNNNAGVCGAAFEAKVAGLRLIGGPTTDATDASAFLTNNQAIHIKSSSWGPPNDGADLYGIGPLAEAALAQGAKTGRGGRGTIYVFAVGNGLVEGDNANYNTYAQSIYTIAVGAVTDQGLPTDYSTPGACLTVSAPSGGFNRPAIATTDLTGSSGYNTPQTPSDFASKSYTRIFNGTSASTPLVSGIVALLLQANPNLGWRDVKEILLRTATRNAPADSDWSVNAAGFQFNHKFGAGLINAQAAVTAAVSWTNLAPATNQSVAVNGVGLDIPDARSTGVNVPFAFTNDPLRVEHVRLTVDLVHPRRGDIAISVTAPSGMKSRFTERHNDINQNFYSWPLTSVRHWGENSAGTWTVNFADLQTGQTGQLISARLELIGTPVNPLIYVESGLRELPDQSNENGSLDPGETVQESVLLRNTGSSALNGWTSVLTTTTPGVSVLQAAGAYPTLPAGGTASNATAFSYRVARNVPCGTRIDFRLVSTNLTVRLTNSFSRLVGQTAQVDPATDTFASADAPKPVPDLTTTLSSNLVQAAANRIVDDVNVSVRLDHTTVGDLQIALVHPDGTEVMLADHAGGNNPNLGTGSCGGGEVRTVYDDEASTDVGSGSAPFTGVFRPWGPLAALRGKPVAGLWRLRLSDQYSNDFGTLLCWDLRIVSHEQAVTCTVFNRPPVTMDLNIYTPLDTPSIGMLAGSDPDGDSITFHIVTPPAHGQLTNFAPNTGAFTYTPAPGYLGSDLFAFHASDGSTNSAVATVNLFVEPRLPTFAQFERLADCRFTVRVLAPSGPAYSIEASTNLVIWLPIATNTSPATPFEFIDIDAGKFSRRFYRVKQ
jgi:subtilisin-like proprotein convertase family protein